MGPDRLGFQKFVVFLAIAPHHGDRADLNFIIHTGSNNILKPDDARFLIFIQHVLTVRLHLWLLDLGSNQGPTD